jgi:hypothetical protein
MQQELLPLEGLTALAPAIDHRRVRTRSSVRTAGAIILEALQLAIDFTRARQVEHRQRGSGGNEPPLVYLEMPRTRGDCRGPGICPIFRCRHNLALRVKDTGAIKVDGGGPGTTLRIGGRAGPRRVDRIVDAIIAKADAIGSLCTLDFAEEGERSIPEVAEILGIGEEIVRQLFIEARHELDIAAARERRAEQRKQAPLVQIRKRL